VPGECEEVLHSGKIAATVSAAMVLTVSFAPEAVLLTDLTAPDVMLTTRSPVYIYKKKENTEEQINRVILSCITIE
jgi:hypothetical protein